LFVEENIKGMDNFTQDLFELNDAIGKGFSCSEIIYDVQKETRLKCFMNRPQRRIQFNTLTRQPQLRSIDNPFFGIELPEKKFIIHRASSKYENPFGDAIDQNIYWMWMFKRLVTKFWVTHLEVGVAPVPIVKHPTAANDKMKAEALDIARQIRAGAFGRIPANMELLWAEAKNMAQVGVSYDSCIEHINSEITKAILGQVLTTEGSGKEGSGSLALGNVHSEVLEVRANYYANALACTLNATVVPWLIDFNFAGITQYPRFQFVTKKELDRKMEADIIKTLSDAGFGFDEKELSEIFNYEITKKEVNPIPTGLQPKLDENGKPIVTKPIQEPVEEK
jgi:phage gp29-like protein